MRLRTIALALALACGFSVAGEATRHNVVRPAAKSHKIKPRARTRYKTRKFRSGKYRKPSAKVRARHS